MPIGLGGEQLWFCASLDSGGGDLSGYGNDATLSGGVSTASPPSGSTDVAWFASGTGHSLNMDNAGAALRTSSLASGKFSMSFWVLPEATNLQRTFGSRQSTAGTRLRSGRTSIGTVFAVFVDADGNNVASANNGTTTTEMSHFVLVWEDNAFARNYVNGVLQAEDLTVSGYAFGENFGAFDYPDGTQGGGYVDDVRGYDRILTQAEITHLATARGVEGPPGGGTPSRTYHPLSQGF